jgi:hypothetical protein
MFGLSRSVSLFALLLALPLAASAKDVRLRDAGFEKQLPSEKGGWDLFGGTFTTDQARCGDWSMYNATGSGVVGSVQRLAALPGSQWGLTGYGLVSDPLTGDPAFGVIQVTFFDADGNDLGTVETAGTGVPAKTSGRIDSSTSAGTWTFLDTGRVTAPADAAFIEAFTLYVDFTGTTQGVYFDDLRLTAFKTDDDDDSSDDDSSDDDSSDDDSSDDDSSDDDDSDDRDRECRGDRGRRGDDR